MQTAHLLLMGENNQEIHKSTVKRYATAVNTIAFVADNSRGAALHKSLLQQVVHSPVPDNRASAAMQVLIGKHARVTVLISEARYVLIV